MKILTISIFLITFFAHSLLAANCPHCGKSYGEPAPGDEARVYELRRRHEAQCGGDGGGYNSSQMAADMAVGAANAFMRGFNQEMQRQQQQTYQGPTTEAQAMRANATTLNNIANEYYEKGDYNKAVEVYEQALDYDPSDQVIRNNLDRARAKVTEISDADEAERRFEMRRQADEREKKEKLRKEKEKMEESKRKISGMLDDLADELKHTASSPGDTAFMDVDKMPVVDPRVVRGEMTAEEARVQVQRIETAIMRARVALSSENYDEAAKFLKNALEEDPDNKRMQLALGYILYKRDIAQHDKLTDVGEESDRFKRIDEILEKADLVGMYLSRDEYKYKNTLDYLKEEHLKNPDDADVAAAYHFAAGLADGREYNYPTLVNVVPQRPQIISKEAEALVEKAQRSTENRDFDGAITYLRQAEKEEPHDTGIASALYYIEGIQAAEKSARYHSRKASYILDALKHGKGDWEKSITYLKNKHKTDPRDLHVIDALGYAEGLAEKQAGLIPSFDVTMSNVVLRKDVEKTAMQGLDALTNQDYEGAVEFFKRANRAQPKHPGLRWNLNYSEGLLAGEQNKKAKP